MARQRKLPGVVTAATVLAAWMGGCAKSPDAHRALQVNPVTHFGVTLDQQASAQDVAFVALRAIRDDFTATSKQDRAAAMDVQLDTAAVNLVARANSSGLTREKWIREVVSRWTPALAHYARALPSLPEEAASRLVASAARPSARELETEVCEVYLEAPDPEGIAQASVVIKLTLARDAGYWRVLGVGFEPKVRSLPARKG